MDKKKIKFEFTRKGQNKFLLTKLSQRLPNTEGDYVFIDTNGKSCKSGFITAQFEDLNGRTRYIGVLRYEKVMHDIYYFVSDISRKSSWYLLYYNFKYRDVDKIYLDIVWCFSKYHGKEVDEKCSLKILDGLWENIKQAAKIYKASKYNASRIQHNERYRR